MWYHATYSVTFLTHLYALTLHFFFRAVTRPKNGVVALRYPLLAVAVEADAASPFVNVYDLERRRIVRWIDRWQQGQVTRTNGLIYDVQGRYSVR